MMRRENPIQLEMFSSKNRNLRQSDVSGFSLFHIWNYEKIILLIIGFLVVGVVSFSLGVRKGRQLASLNQLDVQFKPEVIKEEIKTQEKTERGEVRPTPKVYEANYTIQVATYRTKNLAQKEAEELRKKGLQPVVLPKGNYIQVCVGNFLNKDQAAITFKELRKKYQDCFIRRL